MEVIIAALLLFGAYKVWTRESFFGAKKQWLKLLIFLPLSGFASLFLLIETIFRFSPTPRLTKSRVAKEIERSIRKILKALLLFSFDGDPDVEARRYVENAWALMEERISSPTPHFMYASAFILAMNAKVLHDKNHPNADVIGMALTDAIQRAIKARKKPNSSEEILLHVAVSVCEHIAQVHTPAVRQIISD